MTENSTQARNSETTGDLKIADTVKEKIASILKISPSRVKEADDFAKDLGTTPLDEVEIVMEMEDTFKIEIPEADAKPILTVGQLIKYIQNRLK